MENTNQNSVLIFQSRSQIETLADELFNRYEQLFKGSEAKTLLSNYLTCKQAAEFLGKSPNALRVMVCKNQLKSIKKGNSLYFLRSDLIEYLESGRRKTAEELAENCEDVLLNNKKGPKK